MNRIIFFRWRNEEGAALLLSLIMMTAVSIFAVTTTHMAVTELCIVRNERIFQDNFYRADSAARVGIAHLESTSPDALNDPTLSSLVWLSHVNPACDMSDPQNWTPVNSAFANIPDTEFAVEQIGIARGSSLSLTDGSAVYDYICRGIGHAGTRGGVLIEIGYRMRH